MKGKKSPTPPRLAKWLLKLILSDHWLYTSLGDFEEVFIQESIQRGILKAQLWYWTELLRSLPRFFKNKVSWGVIMFKNNLKLSWRNIIKNKVFSLINISGLALAMACSIIIFLWINNQLSYDKSQKNGEQIFRIEAEDWVDMPSIVGALLGELPEVQKVVRFSHWETPLLKYKDNILKTEDFVFSDPDVFDIFTLPLIKGNPRTALKLPFSLVLTENMARILFKRENPIGKIIKYDNNFNFTVTGVIKDPENLHLKIKALASFQSLPVIKKRKDFLREYNWNFATYVLLPRTTNLTLLEQKINKYILKNSLIEEPNFFLRPFNEIYFARNLSHENGCRHGNKQLVILFFVISILILLIACINFINLTSARSIKRSREISVRKVAGADKSSLVKQFLGETFLLTFLSILIALILTKLLLPVFNHFFQDKMMANFSDNNILFGILLIFLFTGLVSGIYPSFYLSSLSPLSLLKGTNSAKPDRPVFRTILIIFQFSISIFLMIGTLTVIRQTGYMRNMALGFSGEKIITINLTGEQLQTNKEYFKEMLLGNPDIRNVSFSNQVPGTLGNTNTWEVNGEDKPMVIVNTDPDYMDIMELELIKGRNFSSDLQSDKKVKYIINQQAANFLGFDDPVGKMVRANFGDSEIIGIVKDFHYKSLHSKIEPMAIGWYEKWANIANIKVSGNNMGRTINHIRVSWMKLAPDFPFQYSFLDQSFDQQYKSESRLADLFKYFAFLAIFLANLGLFGLATFVAQQKTREIGIRKVLGASVPSITMLVSKEFGKWVIMANIIAWPAAYLVMTRWLQNFAYRINVGWWVLIISGFSTLIIALLTVSYQSLKAGLTDPVRALNHE